MTYVFCEKYKPTNIQEIIDSKKTIKDITQFLKNFDKDKCKCLLVSGTHGSGKTCRVEAILKHLKYTIKRVNLLNFKQSDNQEVYLRCLTSCSNVVQLLNGCERKCVIVIDELDIDTVTQEKNQLINIMKLNNDFGICPIIFIFDVKHSKLINTLRKGTCEIKIRTPTDDDMIKMMSIVCCGEKIILENKNVIDEIVKFSQNDLRKLCISLYDIVTSVQLNRVNKSHSVEKHLTCKMIETYKLNTFEKEITPDLFSSTIKLLTNYVNINECLKIYEVEKVNIPLMVHQNYLHSVNHRNRKNIETITKSLSLSDVVDNYIYGEQRWDITNVHGFLACCIPSYLAHNKTTYVRQLKFPDDMGKTSNKKLNRKHILNAYKIFCSVDPFDYIYMGMIFTNYVNTNNKDKIKAIMRKYKLTPSDVETIIKIDKTNMTKVSFTKRCLK